MKTKPILPDPLKLDKAGVVTTKQAAALVHVGRCGLAGTTIPQIAKSLGMSIHTANCVISRLAELKLLVSSARSNGHGRPALYVVSVRGWNLLTDPADYTMFPQAKPAIPA